MAGFKPHNWTNEMLEGANDLTAVTGSLTLQSFSGNEVNALICEVQAWRRLYPHLRFESGPNEFRHKGGQLGHRQ